MSSEEGEISQADVNLKALEGFLGEHGGTLGLGRTGGAAQRAPPTSSTRIAYEEGAWKHAFGEEEIEIFMQ